MMMLSAWESGLSMINFKGSNRSIEHIGSAISLNPSYGYKNSRITKILYCFNPIN